MYMYKVLLSDLPSSHRSRLTFHGFARFAPGEVSQRQIFTFLLPTSHRPDQRLCIVLSAFSHYIRPPHDTRCCSYRHATANQAGKETARSTYPGGACPAVKNANGTRSTECPMNSCSINNDQISTGRVRVHFEADTEQRCFSRRP